METDAETTTWAVVDATSRAEVEAESAKRWNKVLDALAEVFKQVTILAELQHPDSQIRYLSVDMVYISTIVHCMSYNHELFPIKLDHEQENKLYDQLEKYFPNIKLPFLDSMYWAPICIVCQYDVKLSSRLSDYANGIYQLVEDKLTDMKIKEAALARETERQAVPSCGNGQMTS